MSVVLSDRANHRRLVAFVHLSIFCTLESYRSFSKVHRYKCSYIISSKLSGQSLSRFPGNKPLCKMM